MFALRPAVVPLLCGLTAIALLAAACGNSDGPAESEPPRTPVRATPMATSTPAGATPIATETATAPASARLLLDPPDHDIEEAMAHVRALAGTIGPRVSGSDAARVTVIYIADAFRSYGYAVEVMEFTYETAFREATVTVDGETIEALAIPWTPSYTQRAEGRAIAPHERDREGAVVVGVREGNDDWLYAVASSAADRADDEEDEDGEAPADEELVVAAALVIVNEEDAPYFVFPQLGDPGFPVVLVPHTEAERFARAVEEGATIAIVTGPVAPTAANVIARPAEGAACDLLLGAHHDTVAASPGASDNASGVAVVLEVARALAQEGPPPGLCFATFGAEESGLFGSAELANLWEETGELPAYMVNVDLAARGEAIHVVGTAGLVGRIVDLLTVRRIPVVEAQIPGGVGSDHISFERVGVPVIMLSDFEPEFIHTPQDVIGLVEPESLDRIGDGAVLIVSALLVEIAEAP